MKVIISDVSEATLQDLKERCDTVIAADGKYASCRGCFKCWTKHPAA